MAGKVLIIGSYPPPYGGVTIHIKRLVNLLSTNGFDVDVIDVKNKDYKKINDKTSIVPLTLVYIPLLLKSFLFSNIIHIHTSGYGKYWRESLLVILAKLTFNKVIITVHGGFFPEYFSKCLIFNKCYMRFWLYSDKILFVNSLQKRVFVKHILVHNINKISVVPAFLPDNLNVGQNNMVIRCNKNEYNILVMGNWMEVYGFDTFIYAVNELINKGIRVKGHILVYIFSDPDLQYKYNIESLIKLNGLTEYINILSETDNMGSIYNSMDVFVRPTHTDGDSISVREALSFGIPVIASDICKRPGGTILFKVRNAEDLADKLKYVLYNLDKYKQQAVSFDPQVYCDKLINIYNNL